MKSIKLIILVCFLSGRIMSQSLFMNAYGPDPAFDHSFTVSPDAYYLWHDVTAPLQSSYLFKVDLNGNLLWKKQVSFSVAPIGGMRVKYQDNFLYLTGGHQNAGYKNFLAKLDTAGNILWTTEIGYGDININSRIIPVTGGVVTTGHRDYIGSASSFTFDITLAKFDDNGTMLWAKAYGDNSHEFLCNVAVQTSNGDFLIAGNYGFRTPPDYDPMLARFDSTGTLLWMKTFEDTSGFFTSFTPADMVPTTDGNFVLTGYSENTNFNYDPHVMKIDGNGNIIWSKRLFQIGWQEFGLNILLDNQNNIAVAGNYELGTENGNFVALMDTSGGLTLALSIHGTNNEVGAIYVPHGQHLAEVPGFGYIYSTRLTQNFLNNYQVLISADYVGNFSCLSALNAYPFSIQNSNWAMTTFTNLPVASTSITGVPVTFTTIAASGNQFDICQILGSDEHGTDISDNLYPNPANDKLNIRFDEVLENFVVKIYDVQGKLVLSYERYSSNKEWKLDTSMLLPGFYMIRIEAHDKVYSGKFIICRD